MEQTKKGEVELKVLFASALLFSLVIIVRYIIVIGDNHFGWQAFRTLGVAFLMFLTLKGSRWAKWVLAFVYVGSSINVFFHFIPKTIDGAFFFYLFMGIFYAFVPCYLILSPNIDAYLESKAE